MQYGTALDTVSGRSVYRLIHLENSIQKAFRSKHASKTDAADMSSIINISVTCSVRQ